MKIEWRLLSFHPGSHAQSTFYLTDGQLKFMIDGFEFVTLEEVPIIEFAAFVNEWLFNSKDGAMPAFYYESSDEEEHPLVALSLETSGYRISSCWSELVKRPIRHEEVARAFSDFLDELRVTLLERHNFVIDDAFRLFRPPTRRD